MGLPGHCLIILNTSRKLLINSLFIIFTAYGFLPSSYALELSTLTSSQSNYKHFFTINTTAPIQVYQQNSEETEERISLLQWEESLDTQYKIPPSYDRNNHFKAWIRDPSRSSCFNIRDLVLHRQALEPIVTSKENLCKIASSKWYDPYSDQYFTQVTQLHIDHVVPLKHAYLAGASEWTPSKRCHYANFYEDPNHLLAVSGHENVSKRDKSPSSYLPPNKKFQCHYIAIWLRIKAIWHLKISDTEASTIHEFILQNHCPQDLFYISKAEYEHYERLSEKAPQACQNKKSLATN